MCVYVADEISCRALLRGIKIYSWVFAFEIRKLLGCCRRSELIFSAIFLTTLLKNTCIKLRKPCCPILKVFILIAKMKRCQVLFKKLSYRLIEEQKCLYELIFIQIME